MTFFRPHLNRRLGIDVYHADFGRVLELIASDGGQESLLADCRNAYNDRDELRDEASRVCFARVVVALLPPALSFVGDIIRTRRDVLDCEIHFSLFCYLHEVQRYDHLKSVSGAVLRLIRDYLMGAESDEAQASWMAGHLLADHWDYDEAASVLQDVALGGYAPGVRSEALRFIVEMGARAEAKDQHGARCRALLSRVLASEKDNDVRSLALECLQGGLLRTDQQ